MKLTSGSKLIIGVEYMKIGIKIRELRQQAEISQETLARALSMTPQAISRWENETTAPDISLLPAIANYFGVSIDALFSYDAAATQTLLTTRVILEALKEDADFEFPKGNRSESTWERFSEEYCVAIQEQLEEVRAMSLTGRNS